MDNSVYIAYKLILTNPKRFEDKTIINFNDKEMPKGHFCLYKTMYILNIFYYVINNEILMPSSDWEAWKNGPVNINARQNILNKLIGNQKDKFEKHPLNNEKFNNFVLKLEAFFSDLDVEDLFEIAHEDEAFKNTILNGKINISDFRDYYISSYSKIIEHFNNEFSISL